MKKISNYLIWILVSIIYAPIFVQLYQSRWEHIDYTHAYFILPISLYIIWEKRQQLQNSVSPIKPSNNLFGVLLLISAVFLFVIGDRQGYLVVTTFSLIPLVFGICLWLYGLGTVKLLSFPILYLILLVPPPLGLLDSLTIPMRYGVSILTDKTLLLFNYPVVRDGLLLQLDGHDIYMGAPCSGFRSLITMIALGLLYVYFNKGTIGKKVLLFLSVIPLALIGNFLRVFSLCLVTYYMGDKAGHIYHDVSGYVIFVFVILGMLGFDKMLMRGKRKV